jgi:RNA polymerase sigma-70 factor (ECF subfamily)
MLSATDLTGLLLGMDFLAEGRALEAERTNPAAKRDWADVQACLWGDETAYERLVRRYERQIGAQMRCLNRNPEVYEALVQDVFVEAYFALKGFRGNGSFLAWLRRIASRVGYRYCRESAKQRVLTPLEVSPYSRQSSGTTDPANASAFLQALLARLGPKDRLVLTLMYYEGCSVREIAERTGWNRAMVKMRASRARRRLGAIIKAEKLTEILR